MSLTDSSIFRTIRGAMVKASVAYARKNTVLYNLTKLDEVPRISEGVDLESLKALRSVPMPGEQEVVWAIQNGDMPESRQVLPNWVSQPIAVRLMKWTNENESWKRKIAERPDQRLTAAMQRRFDSWSDQREARFFFSLKKETHVTHVSDPADLKKMRKEIFMLALEFHEDPAQLKLKTSSGETRRLLALRGQPTTDPTPPPDFLKAGVPEDELEASLLRNPTEDVEGENQEATVADKPCGHGSCHQI